MKSNYDISAELRATINQAALLGSAPDPEPSGPSVREIRIRIQIAINTAIASFSMAVFFMGRCA